MRPTHPFPERRTRGCNVCQDCHAALPHRGAADVSLCVCCSNFFSFVHIGSFGFYFENRGVLLGGIQFGPSCFCMSSGSMGRFGIPSAAVGIIRHPLRSFSESLGALKGRLRFVVFVSKGTLSVSAHRGQLRFLGFPRGSHAAPLI